MELRDLDRRETSHYASGPSTPGRCALSEMQFADDWNGSLWSSLRVGAKVARNVFLGEMPVQISRQYEYDFSNDEAGPANIVRFTSKSLFP